MTRIASIAAAAVLIIGSVGGGVYMKNNNCPVIHVPVEQATTIETNTETSSTVTDTTTNNTESETTVADSTVSEETSQQFSVTKEELIEKAKDSNYLNYFDKFSADYTVLINERHEFHTGPENIVGKIYLDEINLTASATEERYENDKCLGKSLIAIMDNYYYAAEEVLTETDFTNGGYKFLETPDKYYYVKDENSDKVFVTPYGRSMDLDVYAPENWDITGERTENGRKIISISGVQKGDNNYEGVYRELTYTAEVDAETGMTLSYDVFDSNNNNTYSFKVTNYKFDDEAVEFRKASDIINEIENGGYAKR